MKTKFIFALLLFPVLALCQSKFSFNDVVFELPGKKWEVLGQLQKTGQYAMKNKKQKLIVLVSVRDKTKFEFYNDSLSKVELVDKFYNWEKDHWSSKGSEFADVAEIKRDKTKNYIIWSLNVKNVAENNNEDVLGYFIYTERNNKLVSIFVRNDSKRAEMSADEATLFLEKCFEKIDSLR